MLKFAVMCVCCLCCLRQGWSAPVIKASGVQWTEPKGNGKGNLTLIMIPQNNSCTNETDMLIAVKSDYQVVSQDTQLLNLVINEYQNDTHNESNCTGTENQVNGINLSKSDIRGNQINSFNKNSNDVSIVNQSTGINDIQNKQANLTKASGGQDWTLFQSNGRVLTDQKANEIGLYTNGTQNNTSELIRPVYLSTKETLIETTNVPKIDEKVNVGYNSELIMKQDNAGSIAPLDMNKNQHSVLNVLKDTSSEKQQHLTNEVSNPNNVNNGVTSRNIEATNSIKYTDFLKNLNLFGEVEQHSELDPVKDQNNANFYEVEKKPLPQGKEQSSAKNDSNQNSSVGMENPSFVKGNAMNIFKFLNDAQHRETTMLIHRDAPDIFKYLKVTQNIRETPQKLHTEVKFSNITNKAFNYKPFNESELNIFKFLNISEPNVEAKVKKINEGSIGSHQSNLISDKGGPILNEAVIISSKLKSDSPKGERNLRSDSLTDNQVEELEGEEFDIKPNFVKGDYLPSSPNEEEIRKPLVQFNLNKVDQFKAEENGYSELNPIVQTICYTVTADNCNPNNQKEIHIQTPPVVNLSGRENNATIIYGESEVVTTKNDINLNNQIYTYPQTNPAVPINGRENTVTASNGNTEVTTVSLSAPSESYKSTAVSPTCRTSIVYICDSTHVTGAVEEISEIVVEKISEMADMLATKSQAEVKGPPKKITLAPQVDCVSVVKSTPQPYLTTNHPNVQPNLGTHFEERAVYPIVESSLFLANNNEMPKGGNVPVLLNTSSDLSSDVILSGHDGKIAKFHANPSGLTVDEDILDDAPPKIDIAKNFKGKKIIIKDSMENERVLTPGQVLKMQFSGKNIIVEQMPSYRSEKYNNNCESTSGTEPPSNEEPDEEEETETTTKSKTSKKTTTTKVTSTNKQSESSESTNKKVTTQITSNLPDRKSKMKEKEGYTTSSSVITSTQSTTKKFEITAPKGNEISGKGQSKTKTTIDQGEINESTTCSQMTLPTTQSHTGKTSQVCEESPVYVTECKTVKVIKSTPSVKKQSFEDSDKYLNKALGTNDQHSSPTKEITTKCTTRKISMQKFNEKTRLPSSSTGVIIDEEDSPCTESYLTPDLTFKNNMKESTTRRNNVEDEEILINTNTESIDTTSSNTAKHYEFDSFTKESCISTSLQKPSQNKQNCEKNVKIPGESVREIVIQIIRNTQKPENNMSTKSCLPHIEEGRLVNKINFRKNNIPSHIVSPVRKTKLHQIKPNGYEMDVPDVEDDPQKNIKYWHQDENQIGSIDKHSIVYPSVQDKKTEFENFDKEHNVANIPINSKVQDNMMNVDKCKEHNKDSIHVNTNAQDDIVNMGKEHNEDNIPVHSNTQGNIMNVGKKHNQDNIKDIISTGKDDIINVDNGHNEDNTQVNTNAQGDLMNVCGKEHSEDNIPVYSNAQDNIVNMAKKHNEDKIRIALKAQDDITNADKGTNEDNIQLNTNSQDGIMNVGEEHNEDSIPVYSNAQQGNIMNMAKKHNEDKIRIALQAQDDITNADKGTNEDNIQLNTNSQDGIMNVGKEHNEDNIPVYSNAQGNIMNMAKKHNEDKIRIALKAQDDITNADKGTNEDNIQLNTNSQDGIMNVGKEHNEDSIPYSSAQGNIMNMAKKHNEDKIRIVLKAQDDITNADKGTNEDNIQLNPNSQDGTMNVGKEHNEDNMQINTNAQDDIMNKEIVKERDKYDKALPDSDLKLLADSKNVINIA